MRHRSSSSLSAALADPEEVSAEASLPGEAVGGCSSAPSMLMWSKTRATACDARHWFHQATHQPADGQQATASTTIRITCLTVAAAVLTTLSELRDVPSSRKQMLSTAHMLSCWADANACCILHHSRTPHDDVIAASRMSSPPGVHAQATAAM